MFGFFKSKRIVLFDTLLKQATTEEIVAILAHELGHWAHGHVLLTFCVTQTYLFVAFAFFAQCMGSADLYAAFGFRAAAGASDTAGAPALVGANAARRRSLRTMPRPRPRRRRAPPSSDEPRPRRASDDHRPRPRRRFEPPAPLFGRAAAATATLQASCSSSTSSGSPWTTCCRSP